MDHTKITRSRVIGLVIGAVGVVLIVAGVCRFFYSVGRDMGHQDCVIHGPCALAARTIP